jgi:hypothetical protein
VNTTTPAPTPTEQKSEQIFYVDEWYPISQDKRSLEIPGVVVVDLMVDNEEISILINEDSLGKLYTKNKNKKISFEFKIKTKNGEEYIATIPYKMVKYGKHAQKLLNYKPPSFAKPGFWQPEVRIIYEPLPTIPAEMPPLSKATMHSR